LTKHPKYRWFILILTALTFAAVVSGPGAALAVLFEEIAGELHLDLVQIGLVWGIGSLLAIFSGTLSGALIDRFGPKRVLLTGILLAGLAYVLRGSAWNFLSLAAVVFATGGVIPLVTTSGFKISGVWFHRQLGTANGVLSMGMAAGLVAGSFLGATVLSPLLGGWRNAMFFFAALDGLAALPWLFLDPLPARSGQAGEVETVPMRRALGHVFRRRNLWFIGLAFFGVGACQQGMAGYLGLYLRAAGWPGATADTAVSLIYAASLVCILPIGFISDRLGSRKAVLLAALAVMAAGCGWLSAAQGAAVWGAVVLAGMMRDGTGALVTTMAVETEEVGPVYAGTATGFIMTFFFVGSLLSPPIGNKLAETAPGAPFLLWAALPVAGILSLSFIRPPTPPARRPAAVSVPEA
jgi:MFS family permease